MMQFATWLLKINYNIVDGATGRQTSWRLKIAVSFSFILTREKNKEWTWQSTCCPTQ